MGLVAVPPPPSRQAIAAPKLNLERKRDNIWDTSQTTHNSPPWMKEKRPAMSRSTLCASASTKS